MNLTKKSLLINQSIKYCYFISAGCSRLRYGGAVASLSQLQISPDLSIINLKSKTILWTGWLFVFSPFTYFESDNKKACASHL